MTDHINSKVIPTPRKSNGQFAPGFTGNPKGRPRKVRGHELLPRQEDLHNVLSTEMLKEHDYKQNGAEKSLPFIVLLIRQMKIDALKGDKSARKQLLEWYKEYLAYKFDEKMKFFEIARNAELFSYGELLEINKKI